MSVTISAYRWVPSFAQGYVKDLRVRWALEEAGIPYETTLIDLHTKNGADYRRWQPFGQVPAYRDDEVTLFESGAIVLHIAAKSAVLAPRDPAGRARVTAWVFAALNSVEPHAQNYLQLGSGSNAGAASGSLAPQLEKLLGARLAALSEWLGTRDYLEERFTAGDLMMTMVLRELVDSGLLSRYANLDALRQRCEERPSFGRALDAQLNVFRENAPA